MNLNVYIDATMAAYHKAFSKLDLWRNEKAKAFAKVHAQEEKMTREGAFEIREAFIKEYEDKLKTIQTDLNEAVEKEERAYLREVTEFYQSNGTLIDQSDKALLDSGILTTEEIQAMIKKHSENPTMLRIIDKNVLATGMELSTDGRTALIKAKKAGRVEADIFKSFRHLLDLVVNIGKNDSVGREVFLNAAVRSDEYAEDAKIEILKASIYLDNEKQEELEAMEAAKKEKNWINL